MHFLKRLILVVALEVSQSTAKFRQPDYETKFFESPNFLACLWPSVFFSWLASKERKKEKKRLFPQRRKKIHCGTFVNVIFVYCSVFIETDRRRYWFNSALVLLSAVLYWIAQLLLLLLYLSPVHRAYTLRLQGTQTPFIMVTTATDCRVGENLCVCVWLSSTTHTHTNKGLA